MQKQLRQWFSMWAIRPRHWLAWLVGVLVAVALFLILVPGECVYQAGRYRAKPVLLADQSPVIDKNGLRMEVDPLAPKQVYEYEHGWPWAYLRRAKGYGGEAWPQPGEGIKPRIHYPGGSYPDELAISWSVPDAWPFSSDRSRWRIGVLLLDVFIALAVVILAAVGTERWIRRRNRLLQLSLFELLAATTVAAVVLGWWQWHLRQQEIERRILLEVHEVDRFASSRSVEQIFSNPRQSAFSDVTPVWLQRLLGTERLTPWCRHLHSTYSRRNNVHGNSAALTTKEIERGWHLYSQLHYLETARLRCEPSAEVLGQVQSLRQLKTLGIRLNSADSNFDEVLIDLSPLASMPKLETLKIMCPYLLIDDLLPLLDSPSLNEIELEAAAIMQSELRNFQELHRPRFTISHQRDVEPWGVVYVQLARWMAEDRINYSQLAKLEVGTISFVGLELTADRLDRLAIVCQEIRHLTFGEGADVEELMGFVLACPNLETLRLGDREVTDRDLTSLLKLKQLRSLTIRQGTATLATMARLVDLPELEGLEVSAASMTDEEVKELREALHVQNRDISLNIYPDPALQAD